MVWSKNILGNEAPTEAMMRRGNLIHSLYPFVAELTSTSKDVIGITVHLCLGLIKDANNISFRGNISTDSKNDLRGIKLLGLIYQKKWRWIDVSNKVSFTAFFYERYLDLLDGDSKLCLSSSNNDNIGSRSCHGNSQGFAETSATTSNKTKLSSWAKWRTCCSAVNDLCGHGGYKHNGKRDDDRLPRMKLSDHSAVGSKFENVINQRQMHADFLRNRSTKGLK